MSLSFIVLCLLIKDVVVRRLLLATWLLLATGLLRLHVGEDMFGVACVF